MVLSFGKAWAQATSSSAEVALQVVCAVHFLQCIFFVGTTSSVAPVSIFGFEFSPSFQNALGAWHLLGIAIIAGAFVGARLCRSIGIDPPAKPLPSALQWLRAC